MNGISTTSQNGEAFLDFGERDWEPSDIGGQEVELWLRSDNWAGREIPGVTVEGDRNGLHLDTSVANQAAKCSNGLLGACVPDDEGISNGGKHPQISAESSDIGGEVLEGGDVAALDGEKNEVFHKSDLDRAI